MLEQAGITVDKFGGEAFRAAVSDGQAELAKLLLEKGADINYHKPDKMCIRDSSWSGFPDPPRHSKGFENQWQRQIAA